MRNEKYAQEDRKIALRRISEEIAETRAKLESCTDPEGLEYYISKLDEMLADEEEMKIYYVQETDSYKHFMSELDKEELLYRLTNPMVIPYFSSVHQDEKDLETIKEMISDVQKKIYVVFNEVYDCLYKNDNINLRRYADGPNSLARLIGERENLTAIEHALEKRIASKKKNDFDTKDLDF